MTTTPLAHDNRSRPRHERSTTRKPSSSRRRRGGRAPSAPQTDTRRPDRIVAFDPQSLDPPPIEFASLGLDPRLARGVEDLGFVRTTPIQSAAIPLVLGGGDLIGCAQTGTGKTAAFLLPIMQRLLQTPAPSSKTSTRALVLAPTRELAVQIVDDFEGLGYHTGLTAGAVFGGVAAGPQHQALSAPVDIVVATPGRLLDHMASNAAKFSGLEVLVLDEADRLLDMGFWPSVRRIVSMLPASRQTLFFSATMSEDVAEAALSIMRAPRAIRVAGGGGLPSTITHRAHHVASGEKTTWLTAFLRRATAPTLVFVRTKRGADRLARRLATAGIRCAPLHADRSQRERLSAVEGFRAGRHRALVATDLAARGLDIEGISHVINFDPPQSAEVYVHRVGRTGRAAAKGTALTLITPDDERALRAIEKSLNIRLDTSRAAATSVAVAPPEEGYLATA